MMADQYNQRLVSHTTPSYANLKRCMAACAPSDYHQHLTLVDNVAFLDYNIFITDYHVQGV